MASLTILLLAHTAMSVSDLRDLMLIFASVCIAASTAQATQSLPISTLKTKIMFAASVIGNVLKFAIGPYLVSREYRWIGAAIVYICL